MTTVNERIRQAVRIELARRDSNQAKLAKQVGVSPQYISDVMRARAGNVPEVWQRIFDELDLELVARPKSPRDPE
jgi:transcriptional regulator with XRE-family HTH domain